MLAKVNGRPPPTPCVGGCECPRQECVGVHSGCVCVWVCSYSSMNGKARIWLLVGHEEQDVWEMAPFGVGSRYNDIVSAQQLEGAQD